MDNGYADDNSEWRFISEDYFKDLVSWERLTEKTKLYWI
jgi:hypothetical protein